MNTVPAWILVFMVLSQCAVAAPAYVEVLDSLPFTESNPAQSPDDWLMAHVDVETTGLVPGYNEMIDIGMVLTDLEGKELDRLFVCIMPEHPDRAAPGAIAVNGYSVERWRDLGCISGSAAVAQIFEFHEKTANSKSVLFTGYNAWFDIAFLDHLFRSEGKSWRELYHYFVLDLPSMAWALGMRELVAGSISESLGLEPETRDPLKHTGITGAVSNVEIYRAMLRKADARVRQKGESGN